jgi:hypothetical protein
MADISRLAVGGVTYDIKDETARGMKPKTASVTLPASGWSGDDPYTQAISVAGITAKSKVDIQPDAVSLKTMMDDGVNAMYVANDNGVLTVYALGSAPKNDMTVQVTVTEVD